MRSRLFHSLVTMCAVSIAVHPSSASSQSGTDLGCRPVILYDSPDGIFRIESGAERPVHTGIGGTRPRVSKPHMSPDGRTLAWVRYAPDGSFGPEIWLMDADGENPRPLTPGVTADQPAWSPDGTRIAFTSFRDANADLYVIDIDGAGLQRLTEHEARDEYAAWSPDGEFIAFGSLREGDFDIFVMRSDGSDLRRLTSSPAIDFRPSWSPDGRWIAFSSTRASQTSMRTDNYDIYVMRPDGSDVRRMTHHSLLALRPSWSPRGDEIVYQVGGGTDDGSDWEIYKVEVDGGQPRRLTNNAVADAHPDWNTFQLGCQRR